MNWYKKSSTINDFPEPGSLPIPAGMVRRYHTTRATPEEIKSQGLLQSKARGYEGPKAIYSWPENMYKDAVSYGGGSANIVEFYTDPSKLETPYAQYGDILPEQILAVHEPWHDRLRYALSHDLDPQILRNVGHKDYTRAAEELEKIRGIK